MDFKRVKNDDHPHKWACQIQDRVLEQHFKQGDYLFQSAGGNMNICCCVNHTAVLSCIMEKGKLESAVALPYTQTVLEVSCLNVGNAADAVSLSLSIWCWKWSGMCRRSLNLMMAESQFSSLISLSWHRKRPIAGEISAHRNADILSPTHKLLDNSVTYHQF